MPRPEDLPAVVPSRHGDQNSASCSWRNGALGYGTTGAMDELWMLLNHGQAVSGVALIGLGQKTAEDFWGLSSLNEPGELIYERIYNQPALPQEPSLASLLNRILRRR